MILEVVFMWYVCTYHTYARWCQEDQDEVEGYGMVATYITVTPSCHR